MLTLALIHTTPVTVPTFRELSAQHVPGVRVINLLDDSLLVDVMAAGFVPDAVRQRLRAYVEQAVVAGADAVMSCCSSIGEAMEAIRPHVSVPVWRLDQAMAEQAVQSGLRIGVLGTVETTLQPTTNLIRRLGPQCTVQAVLVEGAYAALQAGDTVQHDARIVEALRGLVPSVDVVVLAQASMARAVSTSAPGADVPILTSPISGLQWAARMLQKVPV